LNEKCGAEYVQKTKKPPLHYEDVEDNAICCSVDGDADRVVFWYWRNAEVFSVLDGDKIATLLVDFLHSELKAATRRTKSKSTTGDFLRLGVVQTAYANGASTAYLRSRGVDVIFGKTGVKHLHHAAKAHFDVGVYFEANGHGTVVFSPEFYRWLDRQDIKHVQRLRAFATLANQVVGNALADALLVIAVLAVTNQDLHSWDRAYEDLPSTMLKVTVEDRSLLVTIDDDTRLFPNRPPLLQANIDDLAKAQGPEARAFVRPSGTEDIVRVYAEANTQAKADALANHVANAVFDLAKGIGPRPSLSTT